MQNTFHQLPALTVVVTGFNQESSIRGAIESVLNQDYAGKLEYIFSDDASSDGTFQIMREMEQAYRGSHSIKLNRNEQNMGITDHLEKVYSLASHEWVMRMDGDDRSFPHRCRILAEAIIKYPQARYIASDVELVVCESAGQAVWPAHLEEDKGLRAFLPQDGTAHRAFLGTASAIRRSLRAPYSEIRNLSMCEDLYEAHRAWLHEGLVVLRNKLVLYVEHSSNISRINPRLKNRNMETFLKGISRLKGINQSFIQAQEAIVRMTEMFLESCPDKNSPHIESVCRDLENRKEFIRELRMEVEWPEMTLGRKMRHWPYFKRNPLKLLPLPVYGRLLCLMYRLKR